MCLSNINVCRRSNFESNCSEGEFSKPEDVTNEQYNDVNSYPIDTSNVSFINELWLVAKPSDVIIKISAFLPVVFFGIFTNTVLLYLLFKNRHLRSPTNLLIGNMATADLASLLIHPWMMLVNDFYQNYELGPIGCKMEAALECVFLLTSVGCLSTISYDRLTAIVLPQQNRLSRKNAKIVMGLAWVVGLVLSTPLFLERKYKERQWLDFVEKYCTEDAVVMNIYWHVIITMMFWIPLSVMMICYTSILVKLSRYEKVVLHRKSNVSFKKKVVKTMFIVVLTFMLCRLPFTVLIFYRNQLLKEKVILATDQIRNRVNGIYSGLWFISKYLIFLNAGLNPVIYSSTNEKFKRAFKATVIHKWLMPWMEKQRQVSEKKKDTRETVVNSNKSKMCLGNVASAKCIHENDSGIYSSHADKY